MPKTAIRVLVIDDDLPSLDNLRLLLVLEGYDVVCASDGASGLAAIAGKRPDIVLCDVLMQGMSGFSLLDAVRADARVAATPFIFLSALSDYEHLRMGMNRGADDYLTKPCTPADLLAAISARLGRLAHLTGAGGRADSPGEGAPEATAALAASEAAQSVAGGESPLTGREQVIFGLIGQGLTSRGIAARLGISVRTVDSHRANIIAKFGLDSAAALIRTAVAAHLERAAARS